MKSLPPSDGSLSQTLRQKKVVLTPGKSESVFGVLFTLTSISTPPQPILNKCVAMSKSVSSLVECNRRGEFTNGKIGEVQCPTKSDAESVSDKCIVASGLVQVNTGVTQVSCLSQIVDIEKTASLNKLPKKLEDVMIYEENGDVFANFMGNSLFEMQLDMRDKKVSSKSDLSFCHVRFINISGCYNCLAGSELYLEVNTNFGSAMGTLSCPDLNLNIPFNADNSVKIKKINVHISKATF